MASEMSLGELSVRVLQLNRRLDQGITRGLRESLYWFLHKVRATFGEQQSGAGPFPDWADLAPSTIARKSTPSGYPMFGSWPAPLARTGALRNSYDVSVEGHEGAIGSDSDYALIHEVGGVYGNHYIPQRSTLGLTFVKYERQIFNRYVTESLYESVDMFGLRSVIHDYDLEMMMGDD